VVLIGRTIDEPLIARLGAELRALGIDIDRRVVAADDDGVDFLVEAVLREGARAAVRVQEPAGRIEISIADPATHGVALREVLEGSPTSTAQPVLVVRSVEFVRAMLLGAPAAPSGVAEARVVAPALPPAPTQEPSPQARPPGLSLTLVSGVALATGGLDAQAEIGGAIRVGLGRFVGAELVGLAPLTTDSIAGLPGANAHASVWLVGGGLYTRSAVGHAGSVELGVGGLAVAMRVTGNALTNYEGAKIGFGAAGYGRVGGSLALTRALALRADVQIGSVLVRPVASAGGPSYPWGYAFATALGGIEARWF
jgi:hypothetical protein